MIDGRRRGGGATGGGSMGGTTTGGLAGGGGDAGGGSAGAGSAGCGSLAGAPPAGGSSDGGGSAAGAETGSAAGATEVVSRRLASPSGCASPPRQAGAGGCDCLPPGVAATTGAPAAAAGVANCVGTLAPATSPAAIAPTTATAELATVATPGASGMRPSTGACASHDSGPIASRSRPSEMLRNARTTRGSNCIAGAARDLLARGDRVARLLVGARGGDDVEDVGDGHDAARQRDLVALDAHRVAGAVPALVMVGDGVRPLPQPRAQRLGEPRAELGVAPDQRPLLVRRPPRLVEDLGAAPRACRCRAAAPPS